MGKSHKVLRIVVNVMEWSAYIVAMFAMFAFFIILVGGGQPGSPRSLSIIAILVGVLCCSLLFMLSGTT